MDKKFEMVKYTINQIMNKVEVGEFNIPKFQRDYVWNYVKIIDLLKSIQKGFPIGILTTADSSQSSLTGKNEIIDSILIDGYKSTGHIVVDGQQRMTSLVSVWYAFRLKNNISTMDADTKKIVNKIINKVCYFENAFYSNTDLKKIIETRTKDKAKISKIVTNSLISNKSINKEVRELIGSYSVHLMALKNWSDVDVVNIFGAINVGSKPLTHVDLMNGRMYNTADKFDLLSFIKSTNADLKTFGKIDSELFAQLIKIYSDIVFGNITGRVNYSKDHLLKFAGGTLAKEFVSEKEIFVEKLKETLKYLENHYSFNNLKLFPKNVYLLTAFAIQNKSTDENRDLLYRKTFKYITSRLLNGDYASGPGAKAMDDINSYIFELLKGNDVSEKEEVLENAEKNLIEQFDDLKYNNSGSALFKLFITVLIRKGPRFIFKDKVVPVNETILNTSDTDLHHFLPTNSETAKEYNLKHITDKASNIVLITKDENRVKIRNKDLNDYLEKSKEDIKEDGGNFNTMLESHFFSPKIMNEFLDVDPEDEKEYKDKLAELYDDRRDSIIEAIKNLYLK